jgi:hypothetical protein
VQRSRYISPWAAAHATREQSWQVQLRVAVEYLAVFRLRDSRGSRSANAWIVRDPHPPSGRRLSSGPSAVSRESNTVLRCAESRNRRPRLEHHGRGKIVYAVDLGRGGCWMLTHSSKLLRFNSQMIS